MGPFWTVVTNLGTAGALTVVILCVVFYFQQKKEKSGVGNGNGKIDIEAKAREMGQILSDIKYLRTAVDGLTTGMNENQHRIAELAGNVQSLTGLVTRRWKP